MSEVADLRIKVTGDGIAQTTNQLRNLTSAGGKAERATGSLMGTLGRFATAAGIAAGAAMAFNKLLDTQRSFDVINAGLVTATGSAEDAAVAFEALQEFATRTPYSLQQVSEGFVKLVNMGLTPSEKALASYGNTASALGKDLNQMIEAVADAATGEFERLKEFGVRASKQGDQVALTFRGVTETVANEAGAIEDYLIRLGETNFGDAMANRMETLDGALSNLGDAWDQLFLNVAQNGTGQIIADGVNLAIDVLGELNDWLNSGEFEGALAAMGEAFGPWVQDAIEAADIIEGLFQDLHQGMKEETPAVLEVLENAWKQFPQNVRAVVQLAATYFAHEMEEIKIAGEYVVDALKAIFNDDTVLAAHQRMTERLAANDRNLADSVDYVMETRQKDIEAAEDAFDERVRAAERRQRERDARRAAAAGKDRLAGYGVDRPSGSGTGGDRADRQQQREYDALVEFLRTEEEALQVSYDKRRHIVERQAGVEASVRQELLARLDAWRKDEAAKIADAKGRELDQLRDSLMSEEESIRASYERRRQIVLGSDASEEEKARLVEKLQQRRDLELAFEEQSRQDRYARLMEASMTEDEMLRAFRDQRLEEQRLAYLADEISYEEYQRNKAAIEERFVAESIARQRALQATQLQMYGDLFGSMSQLAAQFAQGQGKSAERAFKIQKALAYGQAVMSTAAGISRALADHAAPMSYVYAAMAAAKGATQVAAISQQQFSGAYDDGGRIPAGKFGIVGERGYELVQGPAQVTSRRETARLLSGAGDGAAAAPIVTINVAVDARGNTQSSTSVESRGTDAEDAKRLGSLIDERVRGVLIKEQRQGGLLSRNG